MASERVTKLLAKLQDSGPEPDPELMPLVYEELRRLARHYMANERTDHMLQTTALVHEAYIRLVGENQPQWESHAHFFRVAARAMRRVLIDHARAKGRAKRGGGWQRVLLDDMVAPEGLAEVDVMALNDALDKLATLDQQEASIVRMRFFGGMTVEEVAEVLGVSKRKVEGDWTHAKAWLREELSSEMRP